MFSDERSPFSQARPLDQMPPERVVRVKCKYAPCLNTFEVNSGSRREFCCDGCRQRHRKETIPAALRKRGRPAGSRKPHWPDKWGNAPRWVDTSWVREWNARHNKPKPPAGLDLCLRYAPEVMG